MKKLFPGILALLMAFGMMVGCGEKPADSSTPAGSTPPASTPDTSTPDDSTPDEDSPLYALESVKEVLNGSMIQKNVETRKDYTVANQWYSWHADETFDIAWTVTDAAGNATTNVTIVEGDGDYDTVKVNTDLSEDFTYILTGTISDSQGQSVQISFTRKVLKGGQYLPVAITEKPTEQTAGLFRELFGIGTLQLREDIAQEFNDNRLRIDSVLCIKELDDRCDDEQNDKAHCCTKQTAKNAVSSAKECDLFGNLCQEPCNNGEKNESKNQKNYLG